MKNTYLVLVCLLLVACDKQTETKNLDSTKAMESIEEEKMPTNNIAIEVEKAISNNDFRLLATPGRRIVFPGTPVGDAQFIEQQCGYKLVEGYKDTISSEAEREALKQLRNHASAYNKLMLAHCKEQQK